MNNEVKNVLRRIQRQAQNRHDEVEAIKSLRYENNNFTFGGKEIRTTRVAKVQLCSIAGLPIRVFDRLPKEQQGATFNELLERLGDRHFMFRFAGDQLIGAVSPNYKKIDGDVLASVIRRASSTLKLTPIKAIVSPEFSFIRMIPEGITPKLHELVPALSISTSDIGLAAFSVRASIVRLVCQNGLILEKSQKNFRFIHYGKAIDVEPNLKEILNAANLHVRFLDRTRGRYMSIEEKIHFAHAVKRDLGVKVGTAFVDAANRDYSGGRDWFCTINALTAAAQQFPPFKQAQIEEYAGRFLAA